MSTYLSLDIDYWGSDTSDCRMYPFVKKVLALKKPTLVVRDHHHLLHHVNMHPADRLINVDYHDDIVYMPTQSKEHMPPPEEGTWANHVEWRDGAWFQWVHPHNKLRILEGICDPIADVYCPGEEGVTGWRKVSCRRGHTNIPWDDIIAVGIALSPTYWWGTGADWDLGYYQRTVRLLLGRVVNRDELVGNIRFARRVLRRAA